MSDMNLETTSSESHSQWVPLMDYAVRKNVSVSTLRRYIKANKVQYRVENGRYLLLDQAPAESSFHSSDSRTENLEKKLVRLESELMRAQEEIAELRMLVALYEDQSSPNHLDH